jgi:hypothetical protein
MRIFLIKKLIFSQVKIKNYNDFCIENNECNQTQSLVCLSSICKYYNIPKFLMKKKIKKTLLIKDARKINFGLKFEINACTMTA